jgi:ribonuclease HII
MDTVQHCVGIDENGLGARLGPLVVTAVAARVTAAGLRAIEAWHKRTPEPLLDDSKRLVAHGDVRLAEAWARVLSGEQHTKPAELLEAITAVPTKQLKQRCPANAMGQCWHLHRERFKAGDYLLTDTKRVLRKLEKLGITPVRVWSRLVCTAEINKRGETGENRFLVDLHCMEDLVVQIAESLQTPLHVVCGKVGGMNGYTQHFARLNAREPEIVTESAASSTYRLASIGELRFVRDADAAHPLVMLASLVGKYLREVFVDRIGQHFAADLTELRKPSGYHDRITAQFAEATAAQRAKTDFPQVCFERTPCRDV